MIKKVLCVVACLLLILSLCACSSNASPKSAVNSFMKALSKGDAETIKKVYIGNSDEARMVSNYINNIIDSEYFKQVADYTGDNILNFKYTINNIQEDGENAIASISLVYEDWETILKEFSIEELPNILGMALNGKSEGQIKKEVNSWFNNMMKKTPDITKDVEISLIKVNNEWMIDGSNLESMLPSIWY